MAAIEEFLNPVSQQYDPRIWSGANSALLSDAIDRYAQENLRNEERIDWSEFNSSGAWVRKRNFPLTIYQNLQREEYRETEFEGRVADNFAKLLSKEGALLAGGFILSAIHGRPPVETRRLTAKEIQHAARLRGLDYSTREEVQDRRMQLLSRVQKVEKSIASILSRESATPGVLRAEALARLKSRRETYEYNDDLDLEIKQLEALTNEEAAEQLISIAREGLDVTDDLDELKEAERILAAISLEVKVTDMDIYVPNRNATNILAFFTDRGWFPDRVEYTPPYDNSFLRKNQILERIRVTKSVQRLVEVLDLPSLRDFLHDLVSRETPPTSIEQIADRMRDQHRMDPTWELSYVLDRLPKELEKIESGDEASRLTKLVAEMVVAKQLDQFKKLQILNVHQLLNSSPHMLNTMLESIASGRESEFIDLLEETRLTKGADVLRYVLFPVDIMIIPDHVNPREVTSRFDLSFCQVWFDGITVAGANIIHPGDRVRVVNLVDRPSENGRLGRVTGFHTEGDTTIGPFSSGRGASQEVEGVWYLVRLDGADAPVGIRKENLWNLSRSPSLADALEKTGRLDPDYLEEYRARNAFTLGRIQKYIKRGYKVDIPCQYIGQNVEIIASDGVGSGTFGVVTSYDPDRSLYTVQREQAAVEHQDLAIYHAYTVYSGQIRLVNVRPHIQLHEAKTTEVISGDVWAATKLYEIIGATRKLLLTRSLLGFLEYCDVGRTPGANRHQTLSFIATRLKDLYGILTVRDLVKAYESGVITDKVLAQMSVSEHGEDSDVKRIMEGIRVTQEGSLEYSTQEINTWSLPGKKLSRGFLGRVLGVDTSPVGDNVWWSNMVAALMWRQRFPFLTITRNILDAMAYATGEVGRINRIWKSLEICPAWGDFDPDTRSAANLSRYYLALLLVTLGDGAGQGNVGSVIRPLCEFTSENKKLYDYLSEFLNHPEPILFSISDSVAPSDDPFDVAEGKSRIGRRRAAILHRIKQVKSPQKVVFLVDARAAIHTDQVTTIPAVVNQKKESRRTIPPATALEQKREN